MAEECAECGSSFGNAAELVQHAKSAHPSPAPPVTREVAAPGPIRTRCVLCGAEFNRPEELAAHNRTPHESPPSRGAPRRRDRIGRPAAA